MAARPGCVSLRHDRFLVVVKGLPQAEAAMDEVSAYDQALIIQATMDGLFG